eukprot:TRINITY_DN4585_c0_g1_i1.p1 TRINITY_DN4585_c0_g1~~TRINITY_DN4585_c0_g1_i1.p1  ORF type:complete len:504 (+),score=-0.98 TRINITY_DN4585_c0_g1_i1:197-1513(+)
MIYQIVASTNAQAHKILEEEGTSSRMERWKDLEKGEFYLYLAVIIMMQIIKVPCYTMHWSTDPLLHTSIGDLMARNRFELISRCLYCALPVEENQDKLAPIKAIFGMLKRNCRFYYYPSKYISINERMISYKGSAPSPMLQYLPSKPCKWGFKAFVIADSTTGYTWDMKLYTDKAGGESGSFVFDIVMKLLEGIEPGHILFTDNYYSSLKLAAVLSERNIGFVGTVKKNSKANPISSEEATKLKKWEAYFYSRDDCHLLGIVWKDKKIIKMITNAYSNEIESGKQWHKGKSITVERPKVIGTYNKYKGGVDISDQIISYYELDQRTYTWWKRILFHLLDVAIANSYIVFRNYHNGISQKDYRILLAKQLIERGNEFRNNNHYSIGSHTTQNVHFIAKNANRLYCIMVHEKRKKTRYYCKQCRVALCLLPCFENYHLGL